MLLSCGKIAFSCLAPSHSKEPLAKWSVWNKSRGALNTGNAIYLLLPTEESKFRDKKSGYDHTYGCETVFFLTRFIGMNHTKIFIRKKECLFHTVIMIWFLNTFFYSDRVFNYVINWRGLHIQKPKLLSFITIVFKFYKILMFKPHTIIWLFSDWVYRRRLSLLCESQVIFPSL